MSSQLAPVGNPGPQPGGAVTFQLQLNCHARGTVETRIISFPSFPCSVRAIKQAIQDQLSIPACVQTLSYQHLALQDQDCLPSACPHLRVGDTLVLHYSSEADMATISEAVNWIDNVNTVILSRSSLPFRVGVRLLDTAVRPGVEKRLDEVLATQTFNLHDPMTPTNRVFFNQSGGLYKVLALYNTTSVLEWNTMESPFQYLEVFCARILASFADTREYRRLLLRFGVLGLAMRSILRGRLESEREVDLSQVDPYGMFATTRLLEYALQIICNFAELPECQVAIASEASVVYQALTMSISDSFHVGVPVLAAEMFLCLAHNHLTHQNLTNSILILALVTVCKTWERVASCHGCEQLLSAAMRCYTLLVFAQVAITSPHLLPQCYHPYIINAMRSFLCTAHPSSVAEFEEVRGHTWGSILPYLRLLYLPDKVDNQDEEDEEDPPPSQPTLGGGASASATGAGGGGGGGGGGGDGAGDPTGLTQQEEPPNSPESAATEEGQFDSDGIYNVYVSVPDDTLSLPAAGKSSSEAAADLPSFAAREEGPPIRASPGHSSSDDSDEGSSEEAVAGSSPASDSSYEADVDMASPGESSDGEAPSPPPVRRGFLRGNGRGRGGRQLSVQYLSGFYAGLFSPPSVVLHPSCTAAPISSSSSSSSPSTWEVASPSQSSGEVLRRLSLNVVLFFLYAQTLRMSSRGCIVEGGLTDFITCLPWNVQPELRGMAREMVGRLGAGVRLTPPRLTNLAKAVLARMCFGLERMISVRSPRELFEEL